MRYIHRLGFVLILACAIGVPTLGQTMSFFRQFRTPGIGGATAVAADAFGIYVFGTKAAPAGGQATAGVRKFDSGGAELWTRDFSAPNNDITLWKAAADATGVYVLAFLGGEPAVWLRKYSSSGDELWTRKLDFSPLGGLAVDPTGVYVAGGNYTSTYLRKYGPDGGELWTKQFGDTQTGTGVGVDATGVYVQVTYSNGAAGVAVRKWDALGNELWNRQLNPSDVHRTFAAAQPTGFYLAAADAWGSGTFLRKYDSGGDELWSRKIDQFPDVGSSIAVDTTGVYVAGQMPVEYVPYRPFTVLPGQCRSGSGGDSFVRKYDPDGVKVWERQFGTVDAAWASGVAVNNGGVFVVGQKLANAFRSEWELAPPEIDATLEPASAFLAKFETTAAAPGSKPRISTDCVVNAASFVGGGVAPGEMVTIFGSGIGPAEAVPQFLTADGKLATTLAGTRVLFDGVPAPLLSVFDNQSSAIVPYAVRGRSSVDIQVEYKGERSNVMTVEVLPSRPGIFSLDGSGEGQSLILNEDGSTNSPANPAQRGSIITLYATGGGEAASGVEDGQIIDDVLPRTSLPVSVFFDLGNNEFQVPSKMGEVLYAGGVSGSVAGLLQIKVRVAANAVSIGNSVQFALFIGSQWTVYQATVALR